MSKLLKILILFLSAVLPSAYGHSLSMPTWCFWSKEDLSDMELIESYIFNKIKYTEFNSTVGKYVGYNEEGISDADEWNKDTAHMASLKAQVDTVCKPNAQLYYITILSKTVEPEVKVRLVKESEGSHPVILMCSAYSFYPPHIKVTWLRNGKEVEGGQTSTEETADGDWYYQMHSYLEYMPESGEEITCVVEHASFKKPMSYKLDLLPDSSMSESDKAKIAVGALMLVLGIILLAAGLIYYKKKSSVLRKDPSADINKGR